MQSDARTEVHTLADNLLELAARNDLPPLNAEWVARLAAEVSTLRNERDEATSKLRALARAISNPAGPS